MLPWRSWQFNVATSEEEGLEEGHRKHVENLMPEWVLLKGKIIEKLVAKLWGH